MDTSISKLAMDALYYRITNNDNSCLVSNIAAKELAQAPPEAMDVIEGILLTTVAPKLDGAGSTEFIGLSGVFAAYFELGLTYAQARMLSFLGQLPLPLRLEAIKLIPNYVSKSRFRSTQGDLPSGVLTTFVEMHTREPNTYELQAASKRALSFMI